MAKGPASPVPNANANAPEIDTSLESWIYNTRMVLQEPLTIVIVVGLLVLGTFAEICPRKSLEILDNILGKSVLFGVPLILALFLDWPTGLLAAVVSLIIFTKLNKPDEDEGFLDITTENNNGDVQTTSIVSNTHRWFVEKVLGEIPVAISSDRVLTSAVQDKDTRSSSSSMAANTSSYSSSSSHK